MDRSLMHAEWITEVQWYRPQLYKSPGFRRVTRVVKHQRITIWPGFLGMPRVSVRGVSFLTGVRGWTGWTGCCDVFFLTFGYHVKSDNTNSK